LPFSSDESLLRKKIIGEKLWNPKDLVFFVDGEEVGDLEKLLEKLPVEEKVEKNIDVNVCGERGIYVLSSKGRRHFVEVSCHTLISEVIGTCCLISGEREGMMSVYEGDSEIEIERTIGEMEITDGMEIEIRKNFIFSKIEEIEKSAKFDVSIFEERIRRIDILKIQRSFSKEILEEMKKEFEKNEKNSTLYFYLLSFLTSVLFHLSLSALDPSSLFSELQKSGIQYLFEKEVKEMMKMEERKEEIKRKDRDSLVVGYPYMMMSQTLDSSVLKFVYEYLMEIIEREGENEINLNLKMKAALGLVWLSGDNGLTLFLHHFFFFTFFFFFCLLRLPHEIEKLWN
jgi:hypothetical protein